MSPKAFSISAQAVVLFAVALLGLSRPAQAQATGSFELITPNFDLSLLQSVSFQYTLSQGPNANTFYFTLANTSNNSQSSWVSGTQPTITNIYFEDSLDLLSSPSIITYTAVAPDNAVSYSVAAGGGNLPGGQEVGFDSDYLFKTNPPPSKNGLDPGESLTVAFQSLESYADLLGAINHGDVRIGIHVQEIGAQGASASFVNVQAVPEPGGALLLGALGVILLVRHRRKLP